MGQSPSSKNYTDNPNDYVLVQGNADLKSNEISPRVWTKEVTKQVHKGEFIMTVRAPVGYLATANMDAVIGRGIAAIDGNKYLYYLLQTKLLDRTWEKLSSGSTFESISSNDIKNLEIKVTETEGEKLIAKLMDTVTYFVTLQQRKLEQFKQLKKALLQQLFVDKNNKQPNLRFKNFNGDWEQHKLDEMLQERNEQITVNDKYPLMSFVQGAGVVPKSQRYNREFLVKSSNKKYKKTELGDFIYSSNNLETGSIGFNKTGKAVISSVYSIFKSRNNRESQFIGILSKQKKFINKMLRYRQGVVYGQWKIHESDFLNLRILAPNIQEQEKIIDLFSKIDTLITLQQNKLTQLTTLKKYLLQKLFI